MKRIFKLSNFELFICRQKNSWGVIFHKWPLFLYISPVSFKVGYLQFLTILVSIVLFFKCYIGLWGNLYCDCFRQAALGTGKNIGFKARRETMVQTLAQFFFLILWPWKVTQPFRDSISLSIKWGQQYLSDFHCVSWILPFRYLSLLPTFYKIQS